MNDVTYGYLSWMSRWRLLRACVYETLCICGAVACASALVRAQTSREDKAAVQSAFHAARFDCVPQRLRNGEKLTIRISTPHGRDLAIRAPDGRLYFLVFWRASPSEPEPMVDWEKFANLSELTLNTRDLVAPVVDSTGWHVATKVFSERGKYQMILGTNLETEYKSSVVNTCDVFFEGSATGYKPGGGSHSLGGYHGNRY